MVGREVRGARVCLWLPAAAVRLPCPLFRLAATSPAMPADHQNTTSQPPNHHPQSTGGYYSPGAYLLAKMVLDGLLLRVIPVFIFAAPFYPMVRLAWRWGVAPRVPACLWLLLLTADVPALAVPISAPHDLRAPPAPPPLSDCLPACRWACRRVPPSWQPSSLSWPRLRAVRRGVVQGRQAVGHTPGGAPRSQRAVPCTPPSTRALPPPPLSQPWAPCRWRSPWAAPLRGSPPSS